MYLCCPDRRNRIVQERRLMLNMIKWQHFQAHEVQERQLWKGSSSFLFYLSSCPLNNWILLILLKIVNYLLLRYSFSPVKMADDPISKLPTWQLPPLVLHVPPSRLFLVYLLCIQDPAPVIAVLLQLSLALLVGFPKRIALEDETEWTSCGLVSHRVVNDTVKYLVLGTDRRCVGVNLTLNRMLYLHHLHHEKALEASSTFCPGSMNI